MHVSVQLLPCILRDCLLTDSHGQSTWATRPRSSAATATATRSPPNSWPWRSHPLWPASTSRWGFQDRPVSLLVERWAHDWKVVSSSPSRSGSRIFFSRVDFFLLGLIWRPFPPWHVKDRGHFSNSAVGREHLHMHTPLTQESESGLTVLSRHSGGTYEGQQTGTKLIRKHLAAVVLACWAIVVWSLSPQKVEVVCRSWSPL